MQQKALSLINMNSTPVASQFDVSAAGSSGLKRLEIADRVESLLMSNRKQSVDDTLTFLDGENIHKLFHQTPLQTLDEICQKFIPHQYSMSRT